MTPLLLAIGIAVGGISLAALGVFFSIWHAQRRLQREDRPLRTDVGLVLAITGLAVTISALGTIVFVLLTTD